MAGMFIYLVATQLIAITNKIMRKGANSHNNYKLLKGVNPLNQIKFRFCQAKPRNDLQFSRCK